MPSFSLRTFPQFETDGLSLFKRRISAPIEPWQKRPFRENWETRLFETIRHMIKTIVVETDIRNQMGTDFRGGPPKAISPMLLQSPGVYPPAGHRMCRTQQRKLRQVCLAP